MPAATKARAPRAKAVASAVAAASTPVTAKRPRKKPTPAMAAVVHEKVAFPKVARNLTAGFKSFAGRLDVARHSSLAFGAVAALLAALGKRAHPGPNMSGGHRRSGTRAHRVWARRRASGKV